MKSYNKAGQHIKKQRHYFACQCSRSQSCGFSSSQEWTWELDHKEGWVLKNWCFWTVVLEKTLESPLDFKEIKPVHLKGNQSWRSDAEAIIWPPGAGEDWRQEERRTAVDEMVRWHHWLNGHEFEQALGDGEGQGMVCWYAAIHGLSKSWTWLSGWTTAICLNTTLFVPPSLSPTVSTDLISMSESPLLSFK